MSASARELSAARSADERLTAPGLLVELVGLPGAGKSTLASAARVLLHRAGIVASDGSDYEAEVGARFIGPSAVGTVVRSLPFLATNTRWSSTIGRIASRARSPIDASRRLLRVSHRLRVSRSRADIALPDEWIFHEIALALVSCRADRAALVDALMTEVEARRRERVLVVHYRVGPEIAATRVAARRSASSFDGRPVDELTASFHVLDEIIGHQISWLSVRGHSVVEIAASESPEFAASQVVDAVMSRCAGVLTASGSAEVR
jgi:hypothetical protein